jgi:hypothetical protein
MYPMVNATLIDVQLQLLQPMWMSWRAWSRSMDGSTSGNAEPRGRYGEADEGLATSFQQETMADQAENMTTAANQVLVSSVTAIPVSVSRTAS